MRPQTPNPHRHQHVERPFGVAVLDQGRRARIGELEHRRFAFDLGRDVEQITRIKANIEGLGPVFDLDLLGGAAGIRVGDRQHQLAGIERELDGAAPLARHGGNPVDRLLEFLLVNHELLVVADRNDPPIIRKGAVDELGGQNHVRKRETDLALRQLDQDLAAAVLDQALHLAHGLARHDDARHAAGALGQRQIELGQPVAIGATARNVGACAVPATWK